MRFIKRSQRSYPEVTFIFLDWSVRESFHVLHYLAQQTVDRDRFEVIVVEYYSRVSEAVRKYEDQVDTWVLLEMPEATYYHKHLMYNVGVVLSRGEIVAIVDSDAMVRERFVEKIMGAFPRGQKIVLHLDQFRNNRADLYPFKFPGFDTVVGEGCINHINGRTVGLCDDTDPLHTRNYGACMCALRDDLISIGGADEHIDYLGHICGPYEMTFRLINAGHQEIWLQDEFTYHTWHPGQAGERDYIGPHDGRHVSARALEARFSGRILPFLENPAIRKLRLQDGQASGEQSLAQLVPEERLESWSSENVPKLKPRLRRELFSCRRPVVAFRLCKTFFWLFVRQSCEKISNLRAKDRKASDVTKPVTQPVVAVANGPSLVRVYQFGKRMLEFCLYATQRSRECLNALAEQGDNEVSFYGTDGIADIIYDLTFEMPVTVKNIYDDSIRKRFHGFKVLPLEACRTAKEKLIITSLVGVEEKVRRLKTIGVPPDRIVILQ
jgi:hypothetical protein